ncbi:hypothetical protein ColTof4_01750 [Colletotrichum tofieldiae]|nr:hypothetical protein ColTof3_09968 [Colletotrichum tofieldiae]GKT69327.1 hypothetical protein ColTof4_01750 [Colletotrichum tofieldiae]GKT96374.1 hypothetical protein Ct61P_14224 [Colletotrichum tofieldiae]
MSPTRVLPGGRSLSILRRTWHRKLEGWPLYSFSKAILGRILASFGWPASDHHHCLKNYAD